MQNRTILLLGSGGREHALARTLAASSRTERLFVAPGNAGTADLAAHLDLDITDHDAIEQAVSDHGIDLLVVGPEAPLVAGIADRFAGTDVGVIGPSAAGSQLEGSKSFAKHFMARHDIPTAGSLDVDADTLDAGLDRIDASPGPYVLKADGLAAGKGVLIIDDADEAKAALREMIEEARFGDASRTVVIEDFLQGTEFSVFALVDGGHYALLPHAKDYKRVGEGDTGLNTGGMGAISPVPFVDAGLLATVEEQIVQPTVRGLAAEDIDYVGFLYFGLIHTAEGPKVIEYNCRMGDPETQVVMARLENDLVELFDACLAGTLDQVTVRHSAQHAATVVLASGGYPGSYAKGKAIDLPDAGPDQRIDMAGVQRDEHGRPVTSGGRVLAVTSLADDLATAVQRSNDLAAQVHFEGVFFRGDIGWEFG